jgi:hypothetical protein
MRKPRLKYANQRIKISFACLKFNILDVVSRTLDREGQGNNWREREKN